jgi:uncharacterized protein (TIGR02246 family)
MRNVGLIGAVSASALLFVGPAAAQDEALQEQVEDLQSRYEQAWIAGDADTLASLFTDDAVFWPLSGGSFEGREAIREALEQDAQPQAAEIRSTHTEQMGDFVLDVGTFTMTLPEAQGGTVEGEYLVVAEEADDGLSIHRLISFQPRRPPQQPQ